MDSTTEKHPIIDPLEIPEKKAIIDQILMENAELNGATMVILNELQEKIGFVSKPMQAYVAQKLGVPSAKFTVLLPFTHFSRQHPEESTPSSSALELPVTLAASIKSSKKPNRRWALNLVRPHLMV